MDGYSLIYERYGLPIDRQMDLDTLTWNRLLRDALVMKLRETDEGKAYLKDCWRFTQEEPDYSAIRRFNNLNNKGV